MLVLGRLVCILGLLLWSLAGKAEEQGQAALSKVPAEELAVRLDQGPQDIGLLSWYFWPARWVDAKALSDDPTLLEKAVRTQGAQSWSDMKDAGIQKHGYGTYYIRLRLEGLTDGQLWALKSAGAGSAARLIVGPSGISLVNGVIGKTKAEEGYWWRRWFYPLPYPGPTGVVEIFLQTSNFHYRIGGLTRPLIIGKYDELLATEQTRLQTDLLVLGIIFVLAFSHGMIALMNEWDRTNLYFAIFASFTFMRKLITSRILETHLPSEGVRWLAEVLTWLEYAGLIVMPIFIYLYLRALFPIRESERFHRWLLRFVVLVCVLHLIPWDYSVRNEFLNLYLLFAGSIFGLGVVRLLLVWIRGHKEQHKYLAFVAGLFVLSGSAIIYDVLNLGAASAQIAEEVMGLFFLGQSAVVAYAFAEQRRMNAQEHTERLHLQRQLQSELQTRISIVGELAHRTNNPLHAGYFACQNSRGLQTQIQEKLELIFQNNEEDPEVEAFHIDLNQNLRDLGACLDQLDKAISRSTRSITEIRSLSGVDGYAAVSVRLQDAFQATRARLLENIGPEQLDRLSLQENVVPEAFLYAQKSVLAYVFEHVLRHLLDKAPGQVKGLVLWSADEPRLTLEFEQVPSEIFPAEFLDFVQNILKPYDMKVSWQSPQLHFISSLPKNPMAEEAQAA